MKTHNVICSLFLHRVQGKVGASMPSLSRCRVGVKGVTENRSDGMCLTLQVHTKYSWLDGILQGVPQLYHQ